MDIYIHAKYKAEMRKTINILSLTKKQYDYKKACKIFSASSTRTNILVWKYVNEQIL